MSWNSSDWTAYFGGKGWYGSYDPGKISPSQFIKITAHHGDFEYMIWKMENDKLNNNFGIMETMTRDTSTGNEVEFDDMLILNNTVNGRHSELETRYSRVPKVHKTGAW